MSVAHSQSASPSSNTFYTVAASVAANLAAVQDLAESIGLEAMNAKALVSRAGDRALGFRPITDFMLTLAVDTKRLVTEISDEALALSICSTGKIRSADAAARFTDADRRATEAAAAYACSFQQAAAGIREDDHRIERAVSQHTRRLLALLSEINHHVRAAGVVTATARSEVAHIDERFRDSFRSVTDKLAEAADSIGDTVNRNRQWLVRTMPQDRRRKPAARASHH